MTDFATRLVSQTIPRPSSVAAATSAPLRLAISPRLLPIGRHGAPAEVAMEDDAPAPRKPLHDGPDRQPNTPRIVEPSPVLKTAVSSLVERERPAAVAVPATPAASDTTVVSGSPAPLRVVESPTLLSRAESVTRREPAYASAAIPPLRADARLRPAPRPAVVNANARSSALQQRSVTVRIGRIEIVSPTPSPKPVGVMIPAAPAALPNSPDPLESLFPNRAGYAR
jgi:hypothetical protein